jgi:hypothetical protein
VGIHTPAVVVVAVGETVGGPGACMERTEGNPLH